MTYDPDYDRHLLQAIRWLKQIESKNGGLLNGNFSKAAHDYHVKVRDLREKWATLAPTTNQIREEK